MAWQVEMTKIVRFLIGDTSTTPDNSDSDIIDVIVVSAQLTQKDISFEQTYTIDVDGDIINPDPTTTGVGGAPKDDAFINLVSLRAACILLKGDANKAAKCALSISDGLSRIDTRDKAKLLIDISKNICEEYSKAVQEYELGQNAPGMAIVGPYSDPYYFAQGYMSSTDCRNRTLL